MPRIAILTVAALAVCAAAAAQPKNVPSVFELQVDLSSHPELAKAGSVDVRVEIREAAAPQARLHEEVLPNQTPQRGKTVLRVRLGSRKPLVRQTFVGRPVLIRTAARIAGEGDFTALKEVGPVLLFFERPKTLLEKIRFDRWVILGVAGQILFMMRFLIQWIATERRRESTIPVAFWWCSLAGGLIVLLYGLIEREPIIILGQSTGFIVYSRNLFFIYRAKRRGNASQATGAVD